MKTSSNIYKNAGHKLYEFALLLRLLQLTDFSTSGSPLEEEGCHRCRYTVYRHKGLEKEIVGQKTGETRRTNHRLKEPQAGDYR